MASTTSNPYTFQRPSTMATRSLVSDPEPNSASNGGDVTPKPTLSRRTTNNYEQAATAATAVKREETTTSGGQSGLGQFDRPGYQRQQSWKMSDFKGQQQGRMLASSATKDQGYSSTS